MKVYGQLIKAALETGAADLSGTITGLMSWNTTSGQMKVSDGTNVRAMLRNDGKAIIGNSGTAADNIRLHRGAAGVLQLVSAADATAEGSLVGTVQTLSAKIEAYTNAGLPAVGNIGRLAYVTDQFLVKVDTGSGWIPVSSGGAGGGLRWYEPDSLGAQKQVLSNGLEVFTFSNTDDQEIYCKLTIPESYIAGSQIFLKYGKAFSSVNTGNFLFRATAYLFKSGISGIATPTGHSSTNAQQAINGSANLITAIDNIDITDADGAINAVALAAGDTVLVKLQRLASSETSGVAGDVSLLIDSFGLDLTE